ncbi:carbohydrate sulfotransferase 9-like [Conger conger]|uniref:carbohydrate sulfotransferase 9-like n=1 Tax=Conger conger TaxID=82655 RepID=UPI002A5A842B|nr:carbohydrate sulfotransferase 9-like [Conger conger]
MKTKLAFFLILMFGVLGLLFLTQTSVEETYDVFNPKATLEHSPRKIPSTISQKFSGPKNTAFDPREMTPNHTDDTIVTKPDNTSLLRPIDNSKVKMTTIMLQHNLTKGVQWTGIHEEQERRKSFLQSFCEKFKRNGPPALDLTEMVSQIYVEEKHKILYCEVPKAGCSNWKRSLMVLNGLATSMDYISHDAVHYGKHLRKLDSYNRTVIQEHLSTFTKVLAVRDPVERLVSAFRDKFEQPNPYYHPVFGRAIIRKYRENATREALRSGSGVTFREFIQYLLDPDRPVGMDIHWETVNRLCFPCFITFDFISKFETLEQDANYFLRLIGAPGDLRFPSFKDRHSAEERTSPAVVNHYINQVPPTERQRIYDFFYLDYLMFNYTRSYSNVKISR